MTLKGLCVEGGTRLEGLDRLGSKLYRLDKATARERVRVNTAKELLRTRWWTVVGGNRGQLRRLNARLDLLQAIDKYSSHVRRLVAEAEETVQTSLTPKLENLWETTSVWWIVNGNHNVGMQVRAIGFMADKLQEMWGT